MIAMIIKAYTSSKMSHGFVNDVGCLHVTYWNERLTPLGQKRVLVCVLNLLLLAAAPPTESNSSTWRRTD
jgi:hypothetical protein